MTRCRKYLVVGLIFLACVFMVSSIIMTSSCGGGKVYKFCLATSLDTDLGIEDKSFNASAWEGMTKASRQLGVEIKTAQAGQENLQAFIDETCDLIVMMGYSTGGITQQMATANPSQKFALVDAALDPPLPNVINVLFATNEASFLAGYIGAGTTKSGRLATFGGANFSAVTDFMDGFVFGARYYNQQNGTSVQVLGWDPETQDGKFANSFGDAIIGETIAKEFMAQGADIIFPVAGGVGEGSAKAISESESSDWFIGVDTDQKLTLPEYADIILLSVLKKINNAVYQQILDVIGDKFAGGTTYIGTLANDGVDISDELGFKLDDIKADIINGSIPTKP